MTKHFFMGGDWERQHPNNPYQPASPDGVAEFFKKP